jgi:hypothetical protein
VRGSPAPGKRVAIIQSNYIPWKGYFDLINAVDECIFYDDAQYTRGDWRNRNRIKVPDGVRWLTIPIAVAGRRHQRIRDARISDPSWARRHWETLRHYYREAPWFTLHAEALEELYRQDFSFLTDVNRAFIDAVCRMLGIHTTLSSTADYELCEGRSERLVSLCQQADAAEYVSGPRAQAYLDEAVFERAGIGVSYMDYSGYPEYPQLYGPFDHAVSIVDLLFSTGPDASRYMRTFAATAASGRETQHRLDHVVLVGGAERVVERQTDQS